MSSSKYPPRGNPLDQRSLGTQVHFQWAEWVRKHGLQRTNHIGVFHKKDIELVVYGYAVGQCGVIRRAKMAPKMRAFRPWAQPFRVVRDKLIAAGWTLVSEAETEVGHVH